MCEFVLEFVEEPWRSFWGAILSHLSGMWQFLSLLSGRCQKLSVRAI